MDFDLQGSDLRFPWLRHMLEREGHRVFQGGEHLIAPPSRQQGVPYWKDPVYALENAELTAEAAVSLAMRQSPVPLRGSRVLVCGYGRIGVPLAAKLAALGAHVTVAARDPLQRAAARLSGHRTVDIISIFPRYDIVLNTIPAPVLSAELCHALCIDLASAPGGWPEQAAVLHAPGLPAEYAPEAAAHIMLRAVYAAIEGGDGNG